MFAFIVASGSVFLKEVPVAFGTVLVFMVSERPGSCLLLASGLPQSL